jgi:hypothetical protein
MMHSPWVDVDAHASYQLEKHFKSPRVWSVVNLRVELLVGEVRAKLLSHASDGAAEATWSRRDVAP